MKFSSSLIFAQLATAAAVKVIPGNAEFKANSALGMKLLSQARNLEQDAEEEVSWVAGYSLKFQGCHYVQQWNADAEDDEDVKVEKKRLIRFRLCPTDSCTASNAGGCRNGYGDYVLDLETYINAYYEMTEKATEMKCENFMENQCNCDDDDGKGDDFDRDTCEYDCYMAAGMSECVDKNPYEDDEGEKFEVKEYLECAQFEVKNNNRKLEEAEEEEQEYYIGPYCAEQGGNIFLGVFSEDTCSEFADDYQGKSTYEELTGEVLPYSSESLVGMDCFSCKDIEEEQNNNNNGNGNGDEVWEQCEEIYNAAGKCENKLDIDSPNSNACSYIEGIKITRSDGIVIPSAARKNPVVTAFIVIFAMAFAAMGFYVYYLRTRLGVSKTSLM